jgi:hypothetical protein
LNPGRCGKKPETNRLSYGAALGTDFFYYEIRKLNFILNVYGMHINEGEAGSGNEMQAYYFTMFTVC